MTDRINMLELPFCRTVFVDGQGQLVMDRDESDGKALLRLRCRVGKGDIMTTGIQMPCRQSTAGGLILATIAAMDEARAERVIKIMRRMDAELDRAHGNAKWHYSKVDPATDEASEVMHRLSAELDAVLLPKELRDAIDAAEAFTDVMDNVFGRSAANEPEPAGDRTKH